MLKIKSISIAALIVSLVIALTAGITVAIAFGIAGRLVESDAVAVTERYSDQNKTGQNTAEQSKEKGSSSLSTVGRLTEAATQNVWWAALSAAAALFVMCFMVMTLVLRKFVIHKLKPLYQIVLSKDVEVSEIEDRISDTDQFVEDIEGEISVWAETNRKEIERLMDNERYRKEYVGNVSHEIKTPIFNIQGYISTLLDGGLEDPSINRSYLEKAEKNIERLIKIVVDLDKIAQLESGKLQLKMERFDIATLAREMVEAVEMDAKSRGIKIVVAGGPTFPELPTYVKADKHYISQVLINLLTNSIKYGRDGGHTKISFIDLFDKIMVEVADDGVGINKMDTRRVFERFFRTDKGRARQQGGTGLGLSIVKHIIDAHGESITLRSQYNRGTTLSFTLSKPRR